MSKYQLILFLIIFYTAYSAAFSRRRQHGHKPCVEYKSKMPNFASQRRRISEQKCLEYTWQMSERENIKKHRCTKQLFIIKGRSTKPAEYPHMGALGWKTYENSWIFLCGSVLISDRFLLTAAHCTKTKNSVLKSEHPSIVRLGTTKIYKSKFEVPIDIGIKTIIVHPGYKSPYKYNDIALIKLKFSVTFTKYVQPACLWNKQFVYERNKAYTITGWGRTDANNLTMSDTLLYAKVDFFDGSVCDNVLKNRNWSGIQQQHICAGKLDGSTDTCNGDSGGPLQYKLTETKTEGTMHMVVGITSFGSRICARKDTPSVYTKVSSYIKWIERNVWK